MPRCPRCLKEDMKTMPGASRRSFVFLCLNPKCRASYVQTLGIASELSGTWGRRSKRPPQKRAQAGEDAMDR